MSLIISDEQFRALESMAGRAQDGLHEELNHLATDEAANLVREGLGTVKGIFNVASSRLDTSKQSLVTDLSNGLKQIANRLQNERDQAQGVLAVMIREVHSRIGELVGQIEDGVIDIGLRFKQPVDQVLDRAAWNIISVGAGLLLLLGLVIAGAAVILAKGWPAGTGGVIAGVLLLAFVCLAGALTFFPAPKELVLKFVRKDTAVPAIPPMPEIIGVDPDPVVIGRTREVSIHGVHLTPAGVQPVITIDGVRVDIRGAGHSQITMAMPIPEEESRSVSQLRTVQMMLTYPDQTAVGYPLRLERVSTVPERKPAEIVIQSESLAFDPPSPQAAQSIVHPSVALVNTGQVPSKPFQLIWRPTPGDMQLTATVPSIPADSQPHMFTFPNGYTYPTGGTFTTEISSNSGEMGCHPPFVQCSIHITDTRPPVVLERAVIVFRSRDHERDGNIDLKVQIHRRNDGQVIAENTAPHTFYRAGEVHHLSLHLAPDPGSSMPGHFTKKDLEDSAICLKLEPQSGQRAQWTFDWSLHLTFSDDPTPQTFDFGSDELTDNYSFSRIMPKMR